MNINQIKYIVILIMILLMSKNLFSQIEYYSSIPNEFAVIQFQPDKSIAKKKIRVVESYYCLDTVFRKKACSRSEINKYDKKGKLTEHIDYGKESEYTNYGELLNDTLQYKITFDWLSDTSIKAIIYYNIRFGDYVEDKKYLWDSDGNFLYDSLTNKVNLDSNFFLTDDKNYYYNIVLIKLDNDYRINKISYVNKQNVPNRVFYPYPSYSYNNTTTVKYDTLIENTKIKRLIIDVSVDSLTYNGHQVAAYTVKNTSDFFYDSIGRLAKKVEVQNQSNKYFDTLITMFIYDDSNRLKTILSNDGTYYGYKKGNVNYNYDNNGKLIRMTNDMNPNDSLIDEEFIYDGNQTIRRNSYFASYSNHSIMLYENYYMDGLIQQSKYYTDNKRNNTGTFYIYKKKDK